MILIGQYDSPFVRRVGIALTLYELPFEHRPWSTFGEADKLRPYNPLTRVPTLVLDNGESLIESHAILDYLDSLVPPEKALFPRDEPARHQALKIAALATGLGDKAVSLFYERLLHTETSEAWSNRCRQQIAAVLTVLEEDRASRTTDHWFGGRMGHADIAVATVLGFVVQAHPGLVGLSDFPGLNAHAVRLEALPVFQAIKQPFIPPN
ncbi:MAG: glutathione S-transferase family protein [Rhizobiales bacterium]|jgi:glutathione S-transferase|nr:glutathione S-transferase family protein [Hyphomicrobiales bacterium]MBP9174588.1 glutathione S-transferase family protein [Hyphomicrobiales bacterium]HRA92496.1 glutathione S-transferase family protein [Aestuariivirga sp.]